MTNIKDYLHFYLGCEAEVSASEYYDNGKGKIVSVDIEGDVAVVSNNTLYDRTQYCVEAEISDIKPIIRPLSDMTEEEAKEYFNLPESTIILKRSSGDYGVLFEYKWINKNPRLNLEDGYSYSETGLSKTATKQKFSPKEFQYLLSKGFDLFGLIDSGLALKK